MIALDCSAIAIHAPIACLVNPVEEAIARLKGAAHSLKYYKYTPRVAEALIEERKLSFAYNS
ncbi:hypothetical protein LC608_35350 [Nostoc sp. XA010]|uniref:hypothetical protein n=1 Tax=Nostoc sp. XA010 TaxID=2780407 RepID=UPI001E521989|nr:hypothetical protein [Nostoc sp. XA010]MCC5662096.1 hypothetical protein [Nostoc sp. XA010]